MSQSTMRRAPVSRFSISTARKAGDPMILTTRVRVATLTPSPALAAVVNAV